MSMYIVHSSIPSIYTIGRVTKLNSEKNKTNMKKEKTKPKPKHYTIPANDKRLYIIAGGNSQTLGPTYKYDVLYSHHFSHIITQFYVLLNSRSRDRAHLYENCLHSALNCQYGFDHRIIFFFRFFWSSLFFSLA